MGHNSVVSGHPISTGIPWVDGLSTGPPDLGCHMRHLECTTERLECATECLERAIERARQARSVRDRRPRAHAVEPCSDRVSLSRQSCPIAQCTVL